MALLTTQPATPAGTNVSFTAAAGGGDTVQPGPTTRLRVKNGGGSSITVTVDSAQPCSQGFDHDLSVAVPAGAEREIGPLTERFAQPSTGLVNVTYSGVTTVTVAAVA